MSKILLVEDDVNLREVYATRLMAEGYDVVTASDGEEALASAVKEKPDLVVLDVMMPKISGFDVLDILRSTPETKDAKIIMMTALSQQSDRERGERLGASKYLVKSQVTLEDVVNTVKEMLGASDAIAATVLSNNIQPVAAAPTQAAPLTQAPAPQPIQDPTAQPAITPTVIPTSDQTASAAPGIPTPPAVPAATSAQDSTTPPADQAQVSVAAADNSIPIPSSPPSTEIEPPQATNEAADKQNPSPGETVSPSDQNAQIHDNAI